MTGIFHLFGRKNGAKKGSGNGHAGSQDPSAIPAYYMFQDVAAVATAAATAQRRVTLDGGLVKPKAGMETPRVDARRASVDNGEVAKVAERNKDAQLLAGNQKPQPARISLDSRPKPGLSFYFKEDAPATQSSAEPVDAKEEPSGNSFGSGLLQQQQQQQQQRNSDSSPLAVSARAASVIKRTVLPAKPEEKEKKTSSRDFRGIFKGSFLRREPKAAVDNNITTTNNNINQQQEASPGSSSFKDGIRSRKDSPELPPKEELELSLTLAHLAQDALLADVRDNNQLSGNNRSAESSRSWSNSGRDGLPSQRLTVELREGPHLSSSQNNGNSQVSISDDHHPQSFSSSLGDHGCDPVEGGSMAAPAAQVLDFREMTLMPRGSSGSARRDKDQMFLDGKKGGFSRLMSIDASKVATSSLSSSSSRLSVDGRLEQVSQPSGMPNRLSVDGRDATPPTTHSSKNHSLVGDLAGRHTSHHLPDVETATDFSQKRERELFWEGNGEGTSYRSRASTVVARLMGLDNLPNFDVVPVPHPGGRSPAREFKQQWKNTHAYAPEESSSLSNFDNFQSIKKHPTDELPQLKDTSLIQGLNFAVLTPGVKHQQARRNLPSNPLNQFHCESPPVYENTGQQQQTAVSSPKPLPSSPKYNLMEGMPQVVKHAIQHPPPEGFLSGDMDQRLRQLRLRNYIQERKTLKQILEAMRLKGLLHPHSPTVNAKDLKSEGVARSLFKQHKVPQEECSTSLLMKLPSQQVLDLSKYNETPKDTTIRDGGGGGGVPPVEEEDDEEMLNFKDKRLSESVHAERAFNGGASIVVMKPVSVKTASKLPLSLRPRVELPVSEESESMSRTMCASSMPTMLATTQASERDRAKLDRGVSTRNTSARGAMSQKPLRSSSQELKNGLNTKEALPIYAKSRHQRTAPAAARTAKVLSDVSELPLHDVTPKGTTRSESYLVTKLRQGKETSPLKPSNNNNNSMTKSAFGSTITRVESGGGKVRAKSTTKDHEDARVTTPATRRQLNSGREFEKRKVIEPPPPNVKTLTRSKSDSRLVSNYSERSVSPEPWSRSQTGGKTGENTLPRSNKHTTSGRVVVVREKQQQEEAAVDKSRIPHSIDMELVVDTAAVTKPNANNDNNDNPAKLESAAELLYKGKQPSPVSVLDNTHFQEHEFTPNLELAEANCVSSFHDGIQVVKTERAWATTTQERTCNSAVARNLSTTTAHPSEENTLAESADNNPLKDLFIAVARSLDLDDQDSYLNKPTMEIQVPYITDITATIPIAPAATHSLASLQLMSKDDDRGYVRHIMVVSGVTEEEWSSLNELWPPESGQQIINTFVYDQTEEHLELLEESTNTQNVYLGDVDEEQQQQQMLNKKRTLNRRILFDSVNDILLRILNRYLNHHPHKWRTMMSTSPCILRKKSTGEKLVQEVWGEIQEIVSAAACGGDFLCTIFQKDFAQKGETWLDLSAELGKLGTEMEDLIFDEMLAELVDDMMSQLYIWSNRTDWYNIIRMT
ncbi:unnamed protein product [Sphagnum troendelagicum]|uniref:DUF4378 domain-containing protein n=1 Tax=Sphagnum troendelagicum TaxID=128251 RepID=A0ABP0TAS5_9BRYO